jgi:hypothetical protein
MPEPGFGNNPKSFALRVIAVGQASPRWRGAGSNAQADKLNWRLAQQRADKTRLAVEQTLRRDLPGVNIAPGVSYAVGGRPADVEVGSYGIGSRDSLQRTHGNRSSNEAVDRSVKVTIELITTQYGQAGVSLLPGRTSAISKYWTITITRYHVDAVAVAEGYMEVRLRNRLSGKTMMAEAYLYGGGISSATLTTNPKKLITAVVMNRLKAAARDAIGRSEIPFDTDDNMSFDDFEGRFVRMDRAMAEIFVGAQLLYLTFPDLGTDPSLLAVQHKLAIWYKPAVQGYVVSGRLHLIGPNPGDWYEYDRHTTVPTSVDQTAGDSVVLTFPTQQSDLSPPERVKLESFVSDWTQKLGAGP